jgi:hypothetical protein
LRIGVAGLAQLLNTLPTLRAKVIEPTKHNRFSRANLRASRHQPAFLAIVTKRALERAAGVGQWLWPAIDHAEGATDNAIAAAVANVVLHKD